MAASYRDMARTPSTPAAVASFHRPRYGDLASPHDLALAGIKLSADGCSWRFIVNDDSLLRGKALAAVFDAGEPIHQVGLCLRAHPKRVSGIEAVIYTPASAASFLRRLPKVGPLAWRSREVAVDQDDWKALAPQAVSYTTAAGVWALMTALHEVGEYPYGTKDSDHV